jgi:F0F1-type ATP synthase membrane subunit c/vacuolar-type H+-ATPase subunit K
MATVCDTQLYTGWKDMFYCTNPASWAYMGVALALGLSIIGAAW